MRLVGYPMYTHGIIVKGEGHFKKLPYLSLSMGSKHPTFPLTEVSVSEVPAILKK